MNSPGFLACLVAVFWSCAAFAQNTNQPARNLAKLLAPANPAAKVNPDDFRKTRQKMVAILEALQKSERTNGPGPESLLPKAYEFREDVGNLERLLTSNAILNAWREAEGRGLFNEIGKFNGTATKGRSAGQTIVFEWIVPPGVFPPASNQLANLRLVSEGEQRNPDSPLSERESLLHREFVKMMDEKERGRALARFENPPATDALGNTAADNEARWKKAMEAAGNPVDLKPNIRLEGKVTGTPSHSTGQRWRVAVEILNFSTHPTETIVDVYLLGQTEKKGSYYVMAKSTHPLKLLANENRRLEVLTRDQNSYKKKADDHDGLSKAERAKSRVRFRGFLVVARHGKEGKEVVSFAGSDQRLAGFANPENDQSPLAGLPAF